MTAIDQAAEARKSEILTHVRDFVATLPEKAQEMAVPAVAWLESQSPWSLCFTADWTAKQVLADAYSNVKSAR